MKVTADFAECGAVKMFYAGEIAYNTDDVDEGVVICKAPQHMLITRAVAKVTEAFNAATTNVVVLGVKTDDDAILAAADITEGTTGVYSADKFVEVAKGADIIAKYTQTGTAASTGAAEFYLFGVAIPD